MVSKGTPFPYLQFMFHTVGLSVPHLSLRLSQYNGKAHDHRGGQLLPRLHGRPQVWARGHLPPEKVVKWFDAL